MLVGRHRILRGWEFVIRCMSVKRETMSVESIRQATEEGAICVDYQRQLLAEVDELRAEVERLQEALREAAGMTEYEQDRTLIYNHCMEAAEGRDE